MWQPVLLHPFLIDKITIDADAFLIPLHLALMTFDEAAEVDAVRVQCSRLIFP